MRMLITLIALALASAGEAAAGCAQVTSSDVISFDQGAGRCAAASR